MDEDTHYHYKFKYILLGDESVGKSNIALKYRDNKFDPESFSTIGLDF